ncbi:MAG: formyltransferase family protein [Pseudomonadota bacterium]
MTEKIWIACIDEPIYYGRIFKRLLEAHPDKIHTVVRLPFTPDQSALSEAWFRLRFMGPKSLIQLAVLHVKARLARTGDFFTVARQCEDVNAVSLDSEQALHRLVTEQQPDCVIAVVKQKVPAGCLRVPRYGWVNVHCGPLPRYAGLDAPFWCLLNEEPALATTLHLMEETFDSGDILIQKSIPNTGAPYFDTLNRLFEEAYDGFDELVSALPSTHQRRVAQDLSQRTYVGRPQVADGKAFKRKGFSFF